MNTSVSIFAEIPEELHESLNNFLEIHVTGTLIGFLLLLYPCFSYKIRIMIFLNQLQIIVLALMFV